MCVCVWVQDSSGLPLWLLPVFRWEKPYGRFQHRGDYDFTPFHLSVYLFIGLLVCWFVGLFVSRFTQKTTRNDFHWSVWTDDEEAKVLFIVGTVGFLYNYLDLLCKVPGDDVDSDLVLYKYNFIEYSFGRRDRSRKFDDVVTYCIFNIARCSGGFLPISPGIIHGSC